MGFKIFDSHARDVYAQHGLLIRIDQSIDTISITHNSKYLNSHSETIVVTDKKVNLTAAMNNMVQVTTCNSLCCEKRLGL